MPSGKRFIGGPLDGELSPDDAGPWHIVEGHAYLRGDGRYRYVGVECDGCSSIVAPLGGDGEPIECCPLCGADVSGVRRE